MKPFTLTILGTSSAVPTSSRYTSAHILNVCEHFFLIDCGEATQIRLRQLQIPFSRINHIFISHLHGDHFFGLFGLISSFQLLHRENDLHIYAHKELKHIIQTVLALNNDDLPFSIIYHDLPVNKYKCIYENEQASFFAFPLKHRIPTCGFLVKEKPQPLKIIKEKISEYNLSIKDILRIKNGDTYITIDGKEIPNSELTFPPSHLRSYAYCSDTSYNEAIIPFIKDIDLLYHDATFSEKHKSRSVITGHSTAKEAATIAKLAHVKKLVIGHYSVRYKDLNPLLKEATAVFPNTVLAMEGLSIQL